MSSENSSKEVEEKKNKSDDAQNMDIKMEFTCETESLMDNFFDEDFFKDDMFTNTQYDSFCQVEIASTLESYEENETLTDALMCEQVLLNDKDVSLASIEKVEDPNENNFQLGNVMSDHNYTSSQRIEAFSDLRDKLINHIICKNISNNESSFAQESKISVEISEFVDMILDKINAFHVEKEGKTNTNEFSLSTDHIKHEDNDRDAFLQNIIDAVVAEDAAEETENNFQVSAENSKEPPVDLKNHASSLLQPVENEKNEEKYKKIDSDVELENNAEAGINMEASTQSLTLSENCSEPLEHSNEQEQEQLENEQFENVFNILNTSVKSGRTLKILENLKSFAKCMVDDCMSFTTASTDIEGKLLVYMKEQFEKFKTLIDINNFFVEMSTQTDRKPSARKLKRLNSRNKKDMLESSNSSASSSDESFHSEKVSVMQRKVQTSSENLKKSISYHHNEKEYDDGIAISQYIQSEVFDYDSRSSQSSGSSKKSKNDSDKENTNSLTNKKKSYSDNSDDSDGTDNEIERLINLNGLSKRKSSHSSQLKLTDKTRTKIQNQKNKHDIAELYDDENQKDPVSEESMSENEEKITEKQYLARYNQNLKEELLNESSSIDSEEVSDSDLVQPLSTDDENAPLIDKFLKNFNVEESEADEIDKESELHDDDMNDNLTAVCEEPNNNKLEICCDALAESKKSNASSPDNSDCELLNDNLLFRKRNRPKSLEKMLAEVDKRKKINKIDEDLISLSSESECSDVEAVEVEQAEVKSRIIKPMLRQDQLASETRKAQKHETDRIRRLEKKQIMLTKVLKDKSIRDDEIILDYHEETKTFIKVHPSIVKYLKPHQIEGIKFMYDSCYGGIETLKKHPGSGCILAHCMGLGKTLQLIALLHTVVSYEELKTTKILVLCPKSTVMNWADEVVRWLGPLNTKNLKVFTFNDTSDINEKLNVLREWSLSSSSKAGCLLIGYEAFRTLVFYHSYKNRGNISSERLEDIREKVDKYLLKPGADLVVCDEGHIIKNSKSAISLAVAKIITLKRVILTGTPIQNNLKEYYSMVNFIKPLFLGTEKEFANLYANPIKNGQHKDSSKRDIKVMKQRSFVLHKKLSKFVQRKEAELLKTFLPQKFEYVLFIPMTTVQNSLYEYILEAISRREENRGRSLITDYTCLRKIWTHPKVLENAWKNAINQKNKRDVKKNQVPHSDDDQPDDIYDSQTGVMSVTNDWWRHLVTENDLETILPSNKLRTMFEILRMCEEKGEKCLIFSAFVAVLNVVEYFFGKMSTFNPEIFSHLRMPQKNNRKWIAGQDYYRLDGRTPKSIRHEMIKRFNSSLNKQARVFLISAKAGGQGINLIGANRVIILDTSWNPSNDQQNIFRIFRLGQKKNCYVYRLLAMGTMEEKVYSRSVTKQAMSFRVVDEQQIDRHYSMAELAELYTLTKPNISERPLPILPQDSILANLLLNYPDLVYRYHEHDSLLENQVEQELSEQEKQDAWAAYERDLQMSSEIREFPNIDDPQNNFASSKMQNSLSSLSGLDMQSLMNYGSLNQQTASSPFFQSLLSQYSYPASNQQYLDMLNLCRKFNQSSLPYPDLNSTLTDSAFNVAYPLAGSKNLMSGFHNTTSTGSNPLTALGDLSMYGIGAPKNHPLNNNSTPFTQHQHTPIYTPPISNANIHSNSANSLLSSFAQYKQTLENTFPNFYNYSNNYIPNTPKAKLSNNTSTNQYGNTSTYHAPPLGPPTNTSNLNGTSFKPIDQSKRHQPENKITKATNNESIPMSVIRKGDVQNKLPSAGGSNVNVALSDANYVKKSSVPTTNSSAQQVRGMNMGITYPKSNNAITTTISNTNNASSVNMGIVYPSTSANTSATTASDAIKSSNEMQIIPTTNPPGTSTISKQLNEISPSISLTAVRNSNAKATLITNNNQIQNIPFNNRSNASSNNNHANNTIANTINKTISNVNKVKTAGNNRIASASSISGLASASVTAKTAAATAVAAKSVAQQKFSSIATLKRSTPITKKVIQSTTIANNKSSSSPLTITLPTSTPANTFSAQSLTNSTKQLTQQTPPVKTSNSSQISINYPLGQKRVPTASIPQQSTLNIRPVESKQDPSGTAGVYIIETNINEKKLAIGAPTKSGGGTTVTKVKRKAQEPFHKGNSLNETKRQKLN